MTKLQIIIVIVVLLIAVILPVASLFIEHVPAYLQDLSDRIAIIDDLIVRVLGLALLIVGGIGFLWCQIQSVGEKAALGDQNVTKMAANNFWKVAGYGALMGTGGAAFFAAYPLDRWDNEQEKNFIVAPVATKILARWVQVVAATSSTCDSENSGPFANCPMQFSVRAIVAAKETCPQVTVWRAAGKSIEKPMVARGWESNKKVLGYRTIKTCETRIDETDESTRIQVGTTKEIVISQALAGKKGPRYVIFLGDTGCRDKEEQRCTSDKWPAAKVMADAQENYPDLVVHVGDYMYSLPDNWKTWRKAFFDPAKPLLDAAPWILVRGNHEGCSKYDHGPFGYSLFFGKGKPLDCREENWREPTYAVDVSKDLRLIVADTAHTRADDAKKVLADDCAGRNLNEKDVKACAAARSLLDEIGQLAGGAKNSWLITHVPLFGLEKPSKADKSLVPETTAMVLAAWNGLPPDHDAKKIGVILAGDRHQFQVAKYDSRLLQITSGAGGVNLDRPPVQAQDETGPCLTPDHAIIKAPQNVRYLEKWKYCSNENWGYVLVDPGAEKFEFKPVSP